MASATQQVVFKGIKEFYFRGDAIECKYNIKESLNPSTHDWIGLYKLGWITHDDYVTYVWAPLPKQDSEGAEGSVTFQRDGLPNDSKVFYQFCYVASSKQVCGVSTPFQFTSIDSMEELYEEQDPDDPSTTVIKTKMQILEEELNVARNQLLEMKKDVQLLHVELDAERCSKGKLMEQYNMLQVDLEAEKKDKELFQQQLKDFQDSLLAERQSNEHLHEQMRALRDELKMERKLELEHHEMASEEDPLKTKEDSNANGPAAAAAAEEEEDEEEEKEEEKDKDTDPVLHLDECRAAEADIHYRNIDDATNDMTSSATAAAEVGTEAKALSLPERLAGSVMKHLKRASDWFAEDDLNDLNEFETEPEQAAVYIRNDRNEESMKSCPICSEAFGTEMSEVAIEEHIDNHNGLHCPICFAQFDKGYPDEEVTAHVNHHLDENNGREPAF